MVLAFNLFMLVADGAIVFTVARSKTLLGQLASLVICGVATLFLVAVWPESHFGQLRLVAYVLFVHGVIISLALAAMQLRHKRRVAALWAALAVLLAAVGIDAFFIEPYWLQTTRLTIRSSKLDRPLRCVAIADLQTDHIGAYEREVLSKALAEKPDIVLFLGDYLQVDHLRAVDRGDYDRLVAQLNALFLELDFRAPLGVFAVKGNIDHTEWTDIFAGTQIKPFTATENVDAGPLRLTLLSQPDSLDPLLAVSSTTPYHIVLGHHPDYALSDHVEADLLLAGHTHGGQVRLPLIGPLLTLSRVPRAWAAGVTDRGRGRTLIVSRGAGMERGRAPRLRFLCRPEIIVISLEPAT